MSFKQPGGFMFFAVTHHRAHLTRLITLALTVPAALVLLWHLTLYLPFLADDALISLRYADRLLAGEGLTWTEGHPVEGYSNLLFILLTAALGGFGLDLIEAARAISLVSILAALWALVAYLRRADTGPGVGWTGAVSGVAFALCAPVAVWTIGGLEQPLVVGLMGWAFVAWSRTPEGQPAAAARVGLPLGLLCLTRPDGPLIAALMGLAVVLLHRGQRRGWRVALAMGVWPVVMTLGQLAFRLIYYGEAVPNTALLKAHWTEVRLDEGIEYVTAGLWACLPVVLMALIGIYAAVLGHRRRLALPPALVAVGWLIYVASVGGDIFPAHRHLVPALLCFALLAGLGLEWAVQTLAPSRQVAWGIMASGLMVGLFALQQGEQANRRALTERWEWEGETMGQLLKERFGDRDPLMAVTAAGSLPYFSGLRSLDMLGLNDWHIARQPPEPGRQIGHDRGDGPYVLDQQPDLMVFGLVAGGRPKFVSGRQMLKDPRFRAQYQMATLEGYLPRPARTRAWIRLEGVLGIQRSPDRIEVPPYLMSNSVGQPLEGRKMGARLPSKRLARSPEIELPEGAWQLELDPIPAHLEVMVLNTGPTVIHRSSMAPAVLHVPADGARVRVTLKANGAEAAIRTLVWKRLEMERTGDQQVPGSRMVVHAPRNRGPKTTLKRWPFDQGLEGWTLSGAAFAGAPHQGPRGEQARLRGRSGGLLNSHHPVLGDAATGRAVSPEFQGAVGTLLSLRVGGGKDGVAVRLLDVTEDNAQVLRHWAGENEEKLKLHQYDLSAHAGRTLQLEAIDASDGAWAHILLDEVKIQTSGAL